MKIIQSFWSGGQNDFTNSCGWFSYRYNWMSWILSCNQLVKYHDDVELYTDNFGYEFLIKKLKLPYTKVHVVLDEVNHYPKDLWAISKIKTFQKQNEAFLHVDGDVFVWESFTDKFDKSNIVVQNMEVTDFYYQNIWKGIYPKLIYLPDELKDFHNDKNTFSFNMGIVGGNNLDFFKRYCEKSIDFLDANQNSWSKINRLYFNLFFEQLLFCKYAETTQEAVDFLFPEIPIDNEYYGFSDFHEVPQRTYLHLLGNYKNEPITCKFMEIYLMRFYPEQYANLGKVLNELNQDQKEIDHLNSEIVQKLTKQYEAELRNNKLKSENFLLKRDLYNADLYQKLEMFLQENQNFSIVKLIGFELKEQNQDINSIWITEHNSPVRKYELDEFDEILIDELSSPVFYFDLINTLKQYLDEENQETVVELLDLLNTKLKNYVRLKIISIYN